MMEMEYESEESRTLLDYIAVAKRRLKAIIITSFVVFALAATIVVLLPATYRSTAVILIEEQDVPQDLVRSTITSYAVQRIEEIKQRIMTTGNIMSIVERFNLYSKEELDRLTRTEISQDFRSSVAIQPISAEVIDPRSGRPTEAVIAFNLSFQAGNPGVVQKVVNELLTLFLNENLRERTEQSTSTTEFLSAEAAALDEQLRTLERAISEFKEQHKGSLPEQSAFNLSIVDRTQQELLALSTRRQELLRRKIEIESDLAQLTPTAPQILPSGEAVLGDVDRLKALQSEYRSKVARYRDDHPDLQRLKREISVLESNLGNALNKSDLAKSLQVARDKLAGYLEKYTDSHPEVIKQRNSVRQLEDDLVKASVVSENIVADNPAYVLLKTQLQSIEVEVSSVQEKETALRQKIVEYDALLAKAPSVEKDYQALIRDYDNAGLKYREIKAKQMEADLAKSLEQERKGERFTLIQPPEVPQAPISPNRMFLIIVGGLLAVASGIGMAMLLELLDPRVYGKKQIVKAVRLEPIVSIPYMSTDTEKKAVTRNLLIALGAALALFLILLIVVHVFVKPLDVVWFVLLRKFGLH